MATLTTQTYFISSGRLNAMYTLRVARSGDGYAIDNYICNLSTDPDKAEAKAREYFDRIRARMPDTDNFKMTFAGYADFELGVRRGKLSIWDTERLERAEAGVMPFGKHEGKRLEDLPMPTVLWWADQAKECSMEARGNVVFQAVCAACMGIALDKGYIATREAKREEMAARDASSQYVGELKQRLVFEGEVEAVVCLGETQVAWNQYSTRYLTKIRCGENIVIYFGNQIAEKGDSIKFKATVKDHNERNGVKQTIVQRPTIIS